MFVATLLAFALTAVPVERNTIPTITVLPIADDFGGTPALPGTLVDLAPTFTLPAVDNPSQLLFTASPDHAAIDGYEADIVRPDGTVLQTLNLNKPVPDANGLITAALNVQPIAFATGYWVQVRAKAGTSLSGNAVSQNAFNRVPGGPSGVRVK